MDIFRLDGIFALFVIWIQLAHVHLDLQNLPAHELIHLFGNDEIPSDHFFSSPVKTVLDNGTFIFEIDYFHHRYVFALIPSVISDQPCAYKGIGLSHPDSELALVDCSGMKRGIIVTETGDVLLFHPLTPSSKNRTHDHIIHKRDSWTLDWNRIQFEEKIVNKTIDGHINPRNDSYKNRTKLAVITGPLTVEIALFADEKLWEHFQKIYGQTDAESELHSFILATVNNVNLLFNHRSLEPKVQLKIKRYQVLKNGPAMLSETAHNSGDVDILLENFCQYQDSFNPQSDNDPGHWDHALLFTGYDLYRGSLRTVAGYAPVKGMCSGPRSCTINEGLDFGSVFVITHEMGHSLGMFHDGDNGCDIGCCVMSPSVGAGKTRWSSCSVQEFNDFLNELGRPNTAFNCLLDGESEASNVDYSLQGDYPGQRYNADQQCRFYHGSCWKQELREGQSLSEICDMIWCGEGEGVIRTAHPALEGTYCGDQKWCLQGQCRPWPNSLRPDPVDGSWTSWNDAPSDGCGLNCDAPCVVIGQIMVKRSIRLCENPAFNNGGKSCDGYAYRAFVCSDTICQGQKPNEYATTLCTNLRDGTGPAGPAILQLSGRGFQHQEQPCRVWCQLLTGSFARSIGNFPDGTPCGVNHFCVRGLCMKRSCDDQALVMDDDDCPVTIEITDAKSAWTIWSLWSDCSITCGVGGRRQRTRSCQIDACKGKDRQLEPCPTVRRCPDVRDRQQQRHFLSAWLPWSDWTPCDATCGVGLRQRIRQCATTACSDTALQSEECVLEPCHVIGTWTSWASWSICSVSCGEGTQERRRYCTGDPNCIGNNAEIRRCHFGSCPVGGFGFWSSWSQWSACSRSCGPGGAQYRTRSCSASKCLGSNVSFSRCNVLDCVNPNGISAAAVKSEEIQGRWTEWSNWNGCTRTCDVIGTDQRSRTCIGQQQGTRRIRCTGPSIETRLCRC